MKLIISKFTGRKNKETMIQYVILMLLFLGSFVQELQSQNLDSLGFNDSPQLNQFESEYFNEIFKNERGDFNFNQVKAIFVTGPSGSEIVKKDEYFNRFVKPYLIKKTEPTTYFRVLNQEEKIKSGGYDVIILCWVKKFTERKQKRTIRKAKRKTKHLL